MLKTDYIVDETRKLVISEKLQKVEIPPGRLDLHVSDNSSNYKLKLPNSNSLDMMTT